MPFHFIRKLIRKKDQRMKSYKSLLVLWPLFGGTLFAHSGHTKFPHVHNDGMTIDLLAFALILLALAGVSLMVKDKFKAK